MILVTGGTGQLGTALASILDRAVYPTRDELDLARPETVARAADAYSPSVIINAGAYTAVDQAEHDEATAWRVNADSVKALSAYASRQSIPFVTVSTDYVFDGDTATPYLESSHPNPLNAYGRSKLAGERAALTEYGDALVVRTSWVMSSTHNSFLTIAIKAARAGGMRAVTDQRSCPTSASDLAIGLVAALEAGATGILHMANDGDATRYELALEAARLIGLDSNLIQPALSTDFPSPVVRPRYSVMRSERLASLGLAPLRPWQEALVPLISALVLGSTPENSST
ncbi:MAG: dTDP-4-dehydrorhamnose reductase [Acidimicrobiia bacterium]